MVLNDIFSIDKGSSFLKGVGGTLLMSNFMPNVEFFQQAGDVFMWSGGAMMLVVSVIQGVKNLKKTNLENAKLLLENEQLELENEQLEKVSKRQVIRQMTDITYSENAENSEES
jgi:hypothetical protein